MLISAPTSAQIATICGLKPTLGPPGPWLTVMPHDREIVLPCGRFLKLLLALPITRSMAATCASRSTVLLTFDSIVQPLSVLLRSDVKLRSSHILHTAP